MACNQINDCLFYKKYKSDFKAKTAFIDTACANSYPCARKIWKSQMHTEAQEDLTPAGTYIKKS